MRTVALSGYKHTNALSAYYDAYISIGDGLEVLLPKSAKDGDSWVVDIVPYKTDNRLASCVFGDSLFITNKQEILSEITNNLVLSPNNTGFSLKQLDNFPAIQLSYKTDLLESFYSHLFLAVGRMLFWTDLDNFWEWQPSPHSEADFRIIDWEAENITGLIKLGDRLFVHFPTNIYEVAYVGKPTIVRIEIRVSGVGAVSQRVVQCHNATMFFLASDGFYAWSPDIGLQPIGVEIWSAFAKINLRLDQVWSYVDIKNNEICWVAGEFVWAFNYVDKIWLKYSSQGIKDFDNLQWTFKKLAFENSLVVERTDERIGDYVENVWVTENQILRESRDNDFLDRTLPLTAPYLVTDELCFNDLHFVKKVDLLLLDALLRWPWKEFEVYVSAKDFLSQKDVWQFCGVLHPTEDSLQQIDFPAVAGKVLKFKFVLRDMLDWNGIKLNNGLQLNGKLLDVANGRIIMNSDQVPFRPRGLLWMDGRVLADLENNYDNNRAIINAWGCRVDIPQTLIGPDK